MRDALVGVVPGLPHWTVWIVLASTLVCYSMAPRGSGDPWPRRLLWIVPAGLASIGFAGLGVAVLHALIATRFAVTASHTAGLRTIATCLVALTLGLLSSRFKRPELGWLAYMAVGLGALKLFAEDLPLGNAASLVVSLLSYGLVLIFLPRLQRREPSGSVP